MQFDVPVGLAGPAQRINHIHRRRTGKPGMHPLESNSRF